MSKETVVLRQRGVETNVWFVNIVDEVMGLLQPAVTWYMLEGKLPTGTSKTKKIQIYLDEVALFWMSQWAACPQHVPCDR